MPGTVNSDKSTMPSIRAFIAVDINEDIRREMRELHGILGKTGAKVSWVAPEKMHLTVIFLGDIPLESVSGVCDVMDRVAGEIQPFVVEIAGAGWFGSERSPKVLWADIPGPPKLLADLHGRLSAEIDSMGVPLETRPFRPHLTLGRVRGRRNTGALTSTLMSYKNSVFGRVDIDRLILYKSVLEAQGSRYESLHESTLKGV